MLSEGYRRGQDTGQVLRGCQSYPVLEGWITEGRGGLGPTGSCRCLIKDDTDRGDTGEGSGR